MFDELAIARRLLLRTRDAGTLAVEKRLTCATQQVPVLQCFLRATVISVLLQCISAALQQPLCCYSTFLRRYSNLCAATVHFCVATVTSVLLQCISAALQYLCAATVHSARYSAIREF
jgi:hypothetical protein